MDSLANRLVAYDEDADRRAALEDAVRSWKPSSREALAAEFCAVVALMAEFIQLAAKEAIERGEDTKAMEKTLWKMVDLTVGAQVIVKRVKDEDGVGENKRA